MHTVRSDDGFAFEVLAGFQGERGFGDRNICDFGIVLQFDGGI
jgi:hypothetical protein